jgi:hypothetical protein
LSSRAIKLRTLAGAKPIKIPFTQAERYSLMGLRVDCLRVLVRRPMELSQEICWTPIPQAPFSGWIVGFRWKRNGCITRHYECGDHCGSWREFRETSRVFAVLVATNPSHEPKIVPWQDIVKYVKAAGISGTDRRSGQHGSSMVPADV